MREVRSQILTLDPATDPAWAALTEGRTSSVFVSPPWARVLRSTYGFELRARVVVDGADAPRAGFAYADIEDLTAQRVVSLPFSDFSDPIVDDEHTWHELVDDLVTGETRVDIRCLDSTLPAEDPRFEEVGEAGWHGVDLTRDTDHIWRSLHSSVRGAIRKSEGSGVEVKVASTADDLREFHEMHVGVRKYKYRLLAQPFRFFEAIWDEFIEPGNGFLLLARHDGQPIGGSMFLVWQDVLYYKFNASSPLGLSMRPNDRMLWHGARMGKERGLRLLDFGLSDLEQEGLLWYKRKWATDERRIRSLRHAPPGWPGERELAARELLGKLTGLFVEDDVPDDVSARAGDLMYRYFV